MVREIFPGISRLGMVDIDEMIGLSCSDAKSEVIRYLYSEWKNDSNYKEI